MCAADTHTSVRSAPRGHDSRHLRPPTYTHREVWWFAMNNSSTTHSLDLPRGASMHTHAAHVLTHIAREDKR